jgi:hypothetical protein
MRAYRLRAVAVGRPERGGIRAKEVGERSQKETIVVITGINASDQVDGGASGCGRSRSTGASPPFDSALREREIDQNGQRPFRELLRLRLLERETRVLQQLPVVLDRGVRRPQGPCERDQAFRLVEIAATQFDDAQHMQSIVGARRDRDDGSVLARAFVDPARHLH